MPLIDYGTVDNRHFDIYPYFSDGDLTQHGAFTFEQLKKEIIPSLNETLKIIHQAGIIHRDIKPTNLFMYNGRVIIGDFGIASTSHFTNLGRGTLGYRAPEINNKVVDAISDYYSLGPTIATLYLGKDVYEDKSDEEILFIKIHRTLTNYINFKPSDKHLKTLIDGLIATDVNHRFGYDEVKTWCQDPSNKRLLKYINDASIEFSKPYIFKDQEYYNSKDLQKALGLNWKEAKIHLYRGYLENFFRSENPNLAHRAYTISEKATKESEDIGLLIFLQFLNKYGPLYWMGKEYHTLSEIAQEMYRTRETMHPHYIILLKSKALSFRLKEKAKLTEQERYSLNLLTKIEEYMSNKQESIGYNMFMYAFLTDENGRFTLRHNYQIESIEGLFDYIVKYRHNLKEVVNDMLQTGAFYGYLYHLGYIEHANIVIKNISNDFQRNFSILMRLFDSMLPYNTKIKQFYLTYSPFAYLYWFKNNLHLYDFYGDTTKNLKTQIENIRLDVNMTIKDIDKAFNQLLNLQKTFTKYLAINVNLNKIGKNDVIICKNSDGYFDSYYLDVNVPNGYKKSLNLEKGNEGENYEWTVI